MLTGSLIRLRYVKRFGTCRTLVQESVAEHVAFTVMYSALIANWVTSHTGFEVDMGKLLSRAAFHDIEEARTGDFPRPYKYGDDGLFAALEHSAEIACRQVTAEFLHDKVQRETLVTNWRTAKDDSIEGRILAFADFLSALSYISQEVEGGNKTMIEHSKICREYVQKFFAPEFSFLNPLADQALEMVQEVYIAAV
jgi:5'-deoxynucleotidase YfbR-like HD superfamily hydrolase